MKDARTFSFFLITVIAAAWIGFRAHDLIPDVHTAERQDTGGDDSTQGDDTGAQEENAGSSDVAEAVLAEKRRDVEEAHRLLTNALAPDSAAGVTERAYGYMVRGGTFDDDDKYGKAIKDFTTAFSLLRGYSYAGQGRFEQAIADFSTVILHEPKEQFAYFGRGQAYRNDWCPKLAALAALPGRLLSRGG